MRLDRPVEGLVLFAKNKESERILFKLVRKSRIRKWYMAALDKRNDIARIEISDTITNEYSITRLDPGGKRARTYFHKTGSLANADIYSVFPFTGRRHQIRFHASHYLSPIIGDVQYGSRYKLKPDEIGLMCRGYNFFIKGKNLRIRVPEAHLDAFYRRAGGSRERAHPVGSAAIPPEREA